MNKKIIAVVIAVILIIIAIVCVIAFGGDKKETQNKENPTSTTEPITTIENEKEISSEQETTSEKETTSAKDEDKTETESLTEEVTTEEVTTEEPTTKKQSSKNYEIVWSNPYFFTKKFSDGTEKYYFTYMEEADIFGVETTAIGIIPESQYEYLEHSPDYYINGKTGSNPGSTREETTEQQTSGNTSNNQTEQGTQSGGAQYVTIDGKVYMKLPNGDLLEYMDPGTMTEEEYQEFVKWCQENGVTMTN